MNIIRWFRSRFTMRFLDFAFTDVVSGEAVNYYVDCHGIKWMANSRFDSFRVKVNEEEERLRRRDSFFIEDGQ